MMVSGEDFMKMYCFFAELQLVCPETDWLESMTLRLEKRSNYFSKTEFTCLEVARVVLKAKLWDGISHEIDPSPCNNGHGSPFVLLRQREINGDFLLPGHNGISCSQRFPRNHPDPKCAAS